MQPSLLCAFLTLSTLSFLTACNSLYSDTQASPEYLPKVALDPARNAQLPSDMKDCQKSIAEENSKGVTPQQYMVMMRGCLIQRGHVMLN